MDESWVKSGVILLSIALGITYKKFVRSKSEVRTTKVAEMELMLKLVQSESEQKLSELQALKINHLKQEVYSSIIGLIVPLRTIEVLLRSDNPVNAMWAYKKYKLALKHDEDSSHLSFIKGGTKAVVFGHVAGMLACFLITFMVFKISDYYIKIEGEQLFNVGVGIIYQIGGIVTIFLAVGFGSKSLDYLSSRKTIERCLKGIIESNTEVKDKV